MSIRFPCTLALAAFVAGAPSLAAQCANAWASFGDWPGVNSQVNSVANWDPDGPGPLTPRVVVGGGFWFAGGVAASGVAAWDPATGQWSAIGVGTTLGVVSVLLALPNGDLIAGGGSLSRWNGTTWTTFGGLTPGTQGVAALAHLPNGDLAVGGHFTSAGATSLPYVGVWNGTTWSSLGGGMNGPVTELLVMPNGDLVACGAFTIAGGVPANAVARWNGTAWSAFGAGVTGSLYSSGYGPQADAAIVMPNGDLVVGGMFTHAGGAPASNLARWDGTSWSEFGGGIHAFGYSYMGVRGLALLPNGDLSVVGFFMDAGGIPIPNIAQWDGSTWSSLGSWGQFELINSVALLPNGDLVVGGSFTVAGGVGASRVARWDGTAWSSLGNGTAPSDPVRSLVTMPDGSVVAGGAFRAAGGVAAHGIARWNGVSWSALGGGLAPYSRVNAMALQSNGHLVVGGNGFVSRWDGASWTQLAAGMPGTVPHADGVEAVAVLANGDLVVGGDFALPIAATWLTCLARWDGTAWSLLGGQDAAEVHALATLSNGDLVVGGEGWLPHPQASGIARWNGTAWSPLGSGLQGTSGPAVFAITPLPNGGLIAAGQFATAGGLPANNIARWNGTTWSPLGSGTNNVVRAVHVLPNGDVMAMGYFSQAGGVPAQGIARWNGAAWSAIGAGVQPTYPGALAIAALPNGELLIGGGIDGAGGLVSPNLVRLTTTCPATVLSTGAGCGGAIVTAQLPWTGSTWRADASGLTNAGAVFAVSGLATNSLSLTSVCSTALPGCTLHVQPDFVELRLAVNGTASLQFALPNTTTLAGVTFHHQMVPIALGTNIVTATNALRLTVGSL